MADKQKSRRVSITSNPAAYIRGLAAAARQLRLEKKIAEWAKPGWRPDLAEVEAAIAECHAIEFDKPASEEAALNALSSMLMEARWDTEEKR